MKTLNRFATLPALVAAATLTACTAAEAVDPAIGTWQLDGAASFEASKDSMTADMPAEQVEMALPEMKKSFSESLGGSWTIAADGTIVAEMTMFGATEAITGTWTREGETITLDTTDESGQQTVLDATIDGESLVLTKPSAGNAPEMTMIFDRAAGE